jgi:BTB/POZ domain
MAQDCSFFIAPQTKEKKLRIGGTLTIAIKILLKIGPLTSVSNSSRLFNSSEQSDVTLKCGDIVIPAHKTVLNYHSETLRRAFSSDSFTEGKEGVYEVSSEDVSPDVLKEVIR